MNIMAPKGVILSQKKKTSKKRQVISSSTDWQILFGKYLHCSKRERERERVRFFLKWPFCSQKNSSGGGDGESSISYWLDVCVYTLSRVDRTFSKTFVSDAKSEQMHFSVYDCSCGLLADLESYRKHAIVFSLWKALSFVLNSDSVWMNQLLHQVHGRLRLCSDDSTFQAAKYGLNSNRWWSSFHSATNERLQHFWLMLLS